MTDDGLMGRAQLERAFAALGDRLVRRGVVADLFIVGGAAMFPTRMTRGNARFSTTPESA
jgi:hypothetical protein